jgi:SAM-dependent methyltransferase
VTTPEYALGSTDAEIERLQAQAAVIAEPTAVMLQRGGIEPGMRVLDLGCGPGDVSFLLADLVGAGGSVVGVDLDAAQLAVANRRRDERGAATVEFQQGDARTFVADQPFDAVVCRLLLMHLPEPAEVLAHHLRNLRPGGPFVAVDYDMSGARAYPDVPLYREAGAWMQAGFRHVGAEPNIGMGLPELLHRVGLTDVGTLGLQLFFGPEDRWAVGYVVDVVRSLKSLILASGVVSEAGMGLDTLEERMDAQIRERRAGWTMPTIVGGWGRRP